MTMSRRENDVRRPTANTVRAERALAMRLVEPGTVRYGADGLVPGVVQDAANGEVLMVGYLDAEALEATRQTGLAHFHSRSRDRLWRKGETSGNLLRVESLAVDCDGDALLLAVRADGPACHTGARSCFEHPPQTAPDAREQRASRGDAESPPAEGGEVPGELQTPDGFGWLDTLWETIQDRAATRPEGSYTARLIEAGVDAPARKILEEAAEVVLAAKNDAVAATEAERVRTRQLFRSEVADLVFHLLVLTAERGLGPADVIGELRTRHGGRSGER